MVTDHRPAKVCRQSHSSIATRSPQGSCASRRFTLCQALLANLILCHTGCQSVVDPGRSMNSARPPQGSMIVPPPTAAPVLPAPPATPPASPQAGVLRQPAAAVIKLPQATASETKYHKVVAGDNWTSLARKYQMTVKELTDANGIDPATTLQPGQLVYIPEK
jgi:LysM repeat protein